MPGNIDYFVIVDRVQRFFKPGNPGTVGMSDPISKYVTGGHYGTLAGALNRFPDFHSDELDLHSNSTRYADNVGYIVASVERWYTTNGWTVTV